MTDKELRKMKRPELLKMMLQQQRQIERLTEELKETRKELASHKITIEKSGSLAEASIALSNVFSEAQRAADIYIENIKDKYMDSRDREIQEKESDHTDDNHADNNDDKDEDDADEDDDEDKDKDKDDEDEDDDEDDEDEEDDEDDILEDIRPDLEIFPTVEQLEKELRHARYRRRYAWSIKSTLYALITVAALAVLIAVLFMPVLRIYGNSMNPTLYEGNLLISLKGSSMETGDIVAFYYNNKILVKRVIGQPGQWIDIEDDGTVYVDGEEIIEPYLGDKAFGECDIELPYQVPESRVFVMGDQRSVSVDSRSTSIGCVAEEQLVGKLVFRVWPLNLFGPIRVLHAVEASTGKLVGSDLPTEE